MSDSVKIQRCGKVVSVDLSTRFEKTANTKMTMYLKERELEVEAELQKPEFRW